MHQKCGKDRACVSRDILVDRRIHRHTHRRTHQSQYAATAPASNSRRPDVVQYKSNVGYNRVQLCRATTVN